MKLVATIVGSIKADLETEVRRISAATASGVRDAGQGLKSELRSQEPKTPVPGPGGISNTFEMQGAYDATDAAMVLATLVNDVASY